MEKRGLPELCYSSHPNISFQRSAEDPDKRYLRAMQGILFHIKTYCIWRLQFLFVLLKTQIPKK